jgi:CheY-like chemotaxis protein
MAKQILVVEDDHDIRTNLQLLLEMEGYQVEVAENGQAALDHLMSAPCYPGLIFLDLTMPIMDGIEFLKQLRATPSDQARSVPVVVLSATPLNSDRKEVIGHLLTDFLPKPFTMDSILDVAAKFLQ